MCNEKMISDIMENMPKKQIKRNLYQRFIYGFVENEN